MLATVHRSKALAIAMAALVLGDLARAQGALLGPMAAAARHVAARESRPLTFEGFVLEPDGRPADGAVVVSSAGGKAVTDASGRYVLDVNVPRGAGNLQITAAGRAGTNLLASRSIELSTTVGGACVDPLQLAQGVTCLPRWLPTFGGQPGTDGDVEAFAVFDDGGGPELYVAGSFVNAGAVLAPGLAKWDGTSWSKVGPELSGPFPSGVVNALVVFDDGGGPALHAGGDFTVSTPQGPVNRVGKWDGTSWSKLGAGLDDLVEALAVFDDGGGPALHAGGEFTGRISNGNGTSWSTVGGGVVTAVVHAIVVHDDGGGAALYAGGTFLFAGGVSARRVAKWDGTGWSGLANGVNDDVEALASWGSMLYVGGWFTAASGTAANRIARWNGASWSALGSGTNNIVYGLTAFDDGSGDALYATGSFTTAGGTTVNNLARWDGASWSAVGGGLDGAGFTVAALDDGSGPALFAGGNYNIAGGVGSNRVAKWDGASWSAFGNGVGYIVSSLAEHDDGNGSALYAGGFFLSAGGAPMNRIARWDGGSWSALGSGLGGAGFPPPRALISHDDGSGPALYAGGDFTLAGGVTANRIARWDGASWTPLGSGMNNLVWTLAVYDDGSGPALYAGGYFTTAGGVTVNRIARWDGASWSALGSGMDERVMALQVFDDGGGAALYAGGYFTTAGGTPASHIAKWDGSSWSPLEDGVAGSFARVEALEVFDDGNGPELYAAGYFELASGNPTSHIARWDGSSWWPLGSGLNTLVNTLESFDDGNGPALYAGGIFTLAGGMAANRIARWDGSSWSPLDGGSSSTVYALQVFDDGDGPALYAGGNGQTYDSGDSYLAKWGCLDEQAPTIFHPTLVGALDCLGSAPGEVVTFVVTATDDQDPSPDVVCVPPSGSFFPPGTTLVDCTATDASGNESTAQFPVVVRSKVDQRKP